MVVNAIKVAAAANRTASGPVEAQGLIRKAVSAGTEVFLEYLGQVWKNVRHLCNWVVFKAP